MDPSPIVAGARFHDQLAESWQAGYESGSFSRRLRFFVPYLDRFVAPGSRWLDAGCGTGVLARLLAARGANVVAIDASPSMIAHAISADDELGCIEYRQISTIESLPLPDGSMDGVLCSSVIEYVDAPAASFREFARVLAPGAVLLATVPNRLSLIRSGQRVARGCGRLLGRSWFSYLEVSKHAFTVRRISVNLEQAGFAALEIAGFSPLLPGVLVPLNMGALWLVVARRRAE